MSTQRLLLLPITALLLAVSACSDGLLPVSPSDPIQGTPTPTLSQGTKLLRGPSAAGLQFEATVQTAQPGEMAMLLDGTTVIDSKLDISKEGLPFVSFWAVRGKERTVQINNVSNGVTKPHLKFTVSDPRWAPDGREIQVGDSILIIMSVSPFSFGADFQPAGLRFGSPSRLQIFYGSLGGDLTGDGVVNSTDANIEKQQLGMSYREYPWTAWTRVLSTKSTKYDWVTSDVYHFSEYAVSY